MDADSSIGERDLPLLRAEDAGYVYHLCEATMRGPVVALCGHWPEDEVKAEIWRAITDGEYRAVVDGDTRVGAVSVLWSETCCEIAQLFIEPKYQRQGFGGFTVNSVVRQAHRAGKPVIARVLVTNPARAFWEKVGFSLVESTAEHHLLERHA